MLMAPGRIGPILRTGILSPWGKLRLACESFIPVRRSDDDESLASFARRRLGRETFERLVQPLVGGIYTADPETLSMQAALPRFVEMEAQYGSLLHGALVEARRQRHSTSDESGARYGLFTAPREGMSSLVERSPLESHTPQSRIPRSARSPPAVQQVATNAATHGDGTTTLDIDALVVPLTSRPCRPPARTARHLAGSMSCTNSTPTATSSCWPIDTISSHSYRRASVSSYPIAKNAAFWRVAMPVKNILADPRTTSFCCASSSAVPRSRIGRRPLTPNCCKPSKKN